MADININQLRYVVGTDEDLPLNLVGKTGRDGPQCFLSWDSVSEDVDGFRLVRRKYHYPADILDGDLVFSSVGTPTNNYFADTLLIHEELYYYKAFFYRDGEWYGPDNGQVSVFSGTKLEFADAYEAAVYHESSAIKSFTLPAETFFRRGDRVLTLTNDLAAGDWVRLGTVERGMIAKVYAATASTLTLEYKRDEWLFPERAFTETRDTSLTFTRTNGSYANKSTIARATGSFIDDGVTVGMPLLISGVQSQPLGIVYPTSVYAGVLVFAADTLRNEGPVSSPVLSLASGFIVGDEVTKLDVQGSFLARRIYEDFLPPNFVADDAATAQTLDLVESTDTDGQVSCIGSPGERYGLERFISVMAAEFAKEHAAGNYLPTYRDLLRAPLDYVRTFGERYGLSLPDQVDDSFLLRAIILAQPGVARHRGREDLLRTWCRIITKQNPVLVYGKNRVIRLGELGNGIVWDGYEIVSAITGPAPLIWVSGYSAGAGALPQWLVGWTVASESHLSFRYEVTSVADGTFEANLVGTDPGTNPFTSPIVSAGEAIWFFAPDGEGVSGPNARAFSLYDASVVDGVGSFFSDRGIALYLPNAITDNARDLFHWVCDDMALETASLLVYAALVEAINLL